jgi:hypothetical protein
MTIGTININRHSYDYTITILSPKATKAQYESVINKNSKVIPYKTEEELNNIISILSFILGNEGYYTENNNSNSENPYDFSKEWQIYTMKWLHITSMSSFFDEERFPYPHDDLPF